MLDQCQVPKGRGMCANRKTEGGEEVAAAAGVGAGQTGPAGEPSGEAHRLGQKRHPP